MTKKTRCPDHPERPKKTTSEVADEMAKNSRPATTNGRSVRPEHDVVCVDLFCGAGGLTRGLIDAGVRVVAGVDFDGACEHPYTANHKGVAFHRYDVAKLKASDIKNWFGDASIRLLAGCAPCQPFSSYSQRYENVGTERWGLLHHFARLVKGVLPDIVTMENVPTVTRHKVFDDFVAVSEHLIRTGVTTSRQLGAIGRSNGGLLMGVIMNQRPDLYAAIVCGVPLLDMRNYTRLGAGASWVAEYGDPATSDWNFMSAWSPYQNLRAGVDYPRVFYYTSTRDDRVHPAHARKAAARLAELGRDHFYYENIEGGHGGTANQEQLAYRIALEYAYFARQLMGAGGGSDVDHARPAPPAPQPAAAPEAQSGS